MELAWNLELADSETCLDDVDASWQLETERIDTWLHKSKLG